jgi:UDP-N-acetylmuramoylalanine--D-glutamate ligase
MSAQQLEHLHDSPHIAVLLNVVSDHLDHFATFEDYVAAKSNITRFQSAADHLVFNAMFSVPCRIASESRARLVPCSIEKPLEYGAFMEGDRVCWRSNSGSAETVLRAADVEEVLPGSFNLHNVLPAVAVARLLGVTAAQIAEGLRQFKPLAHRFDLLGTFKGIHFYNAPIATVPEVTIEHINALGGGVQTILLGGRDRSLDFAGLADRILDSGIDTVILFPETGSRIREALSDRASGREGTVRVPALYAVKGGDGAAAMEEAVRLAYLKTAPGRVCLHSPASSSFGLFRDYRERGELFARFVRELANE